MIQKNDEFKYVFKDAVEEIKKQGEYIGGIYYILSHPDFNIAQYVVEKEILINEKADIVIDCKLLGANLIEYLFQQLQIKKRPEADLNIIQKIKQKDIEKSMQLSLAVFSLSFAVKNKVENSEYADRLKQILEDLKVFSGWIWIKNVESITKDSLYQLNVILSILGEINDKCKTLLTEQSFTGVYEIYESLNIKKRIERLKVYQIGINLNQAISFLESQKNVTGEDIRKLENVFKHQNITFTPELVRAIKKIFLTEKKDFSVSYELIGRQLLEDIGILKNSMEDAVSILKLLNSFSVGKNLDFISKRAYISAIRVKEIVAYLKSKQVVYQIHMNNYELNPMYRPFFPVVFSEIEVIQFEKREFNADDYYQIRFNKVVELLQVLKKQRYEQSIFYLLHLFILESYTIGDDRQGKAIFQYEGSDNSERVLVDSIAEQVQNMSFQRYHENTIIEQLKSYFDEHVLTYEMKLTDTKVRSEDVLQLAKIHVLKYLQRMKSSSANTTMQIKDKLLDALPKKEYEYYFVVEVLSFLTLGPLILEYYAENEGMYEKNKQLVMSYPNQTQNDMDYGKYCSLMSKMFIEYMQKVDELSYTDKNWKYIFIEMLLVANVFVLEEEQAKLDGKLENLLDEIIENKHQILLKKKLRFFNLYIVTETSNKAKLEDVIKDIVKEKETILRYRHYWAGLLNNMIRIHMADNQYHEDSQEMIQEFLAYYILDLNEDIEKANRQYHEGAILLNTVFVHAIENKDTALCQLIGDYIVQTQSDTTNSRYDRYYLETNYVLYQLQMQNKDATILSLGTYQSNFLNMDEVADRCEMLKKIHQKGVSPRSFPLYITSEIEYWYD